MPRLNRTPRATLDNAAASRRDWQRVRQIADCFKYDPLGKARFLEQERERVAKVWSWLEHLDDLDAMIQ